MKEIITISVSEYLTNDLSKKISFAQWHSQSAECFNRVRRMVYDGKYDSDCFNVIAADKAGNVVGRLYCLQNQADPSLWYYGDLFVAPELRRMGIATKMAEAAFERLKESGAEKLRTYVEPSNQASLALQKSLGFSERPYEVFDHLLNEGDIMFEIMIPPLLNVVPATVDEAVFVCMFYTQNIKALHGEKTAFSDWKEILSKNDPDEQNFLICKGAMPVAWLRVNGLSDKEKAWISMLVVSDKAQHKGIGTFAVRFIEEFALSKDFSEIGICTTEDNIPAQELYKKCGYAVTGSKNVIYGDGIAGKSYTFEKKL